MTPTGNRCSPHRAWSASNDGQSHSAQMGVSGKESTCPSPFTSIEVLAIRESSFDQADALNRSQRSRSEIPEEGNDAFDVDVEIEGVLGIQDVACFPVNLATEL